MIRSRDRQNPSRDSSVETGRSMSGGLCGVSFGDEGVGRNYSTRESCTEEPSRGSVFHGTGTPSPSQRRILIHPCLQNLNSVREEQGTEHGRRVAEFTTHSANGQSRERPTSKSTYAGRIPSGRWLSKRR